MGLINNLAKRLDSFINMMASLGTGKDKSAGFEFQIKPRLDFFTLDNLYAREPFTQKIVDLRADEITKILPEITHSEATKILEFYTNSKKGFYKALNKALKYRTLHGSGFILIDFDDNKPTSEPLDFKNLKDVKIKKLTVIDKHLIQPYPYYTPFQDIEYWQPITANTNNIIYHSSRVIWLDGIDAGERMRTTNNGMGESLIDTLYESIKNVNITHNIVPSIIVEFVQGIYKIKGINAAIARNNKKAVDEIKEMLEITSWGQSVTNKIVIDSENDYVKNSTNVSGLPEMVNVSERKLIAASKMPHSLLMGESPGSSLGEAGASQKRDWYDFIASEQTNVANPAIEQFNEIIQAILGSNEKIIYKHVPLWQPTELEQAELREIQSKVDIAYHSLGVDNEDIINSRFKDGKYNTNTIITKPIEKVKRIFTAISDKIKGNNDKKKDKKVA